jgi:4-hydroxymandelate oxidase
MSLAPLPLSIEARAALGSALFQYLLGRSDGALAGADDANALALSRHRLVPRVLTGAAGVDISLTVFDRRFAGPLVVGAYAGDRVFHTEGLLPVARVCRELGLPLIVSEETVTPLGEITAECDAVCLQIRAAGPVERALGLLDLAAREGAMGLVVTVLAPAHPVEGLQPGGFSIGAEIARRGWRTIGSPDQGVDPLTAFPAWNWADLERVCRAAEERGLPLLVKGVLHEEDAVRAERAGAGAVIVSNIGLRQSLRWVAPADRLVRIANRTSLPVVLDGGVRSGTDLVVARCLGATFSASARPVVSALAGGGEDAVRRLLQGWLEEAFAITAWLGAAALQDLSPDHLAIHDGPCA